MTKFSFVKAFFMLLSIASISSMYPQTNNYQPFFVNESKSGSVSRILTNAVSELKVIDVNFHELDDIVSRRNETIRVNFNAGSLVVDKVLHKFEILSPGSKIVAGTDEGDRSINMNNSFVVYTSAIQDKTSPLVVMTCFRNDVSVMIISDEDILVLARRDPSDINSDYIFYQQSKVSKVNELKCGSENFQIPQEILEMQKNLNPGITDLPTSQMLKADIAFESDYETFQRFGSVENASKYILSLIAPVSALYTRDVNVQIRSSYLRVWSTASDPYGGGSNSNDYLVQFRAYWNANMQAVPRTLAHYITTRGGNMGGIAYINQLCANVNNGSGYGFSNIDGSFNSLPAYSWDVYVVTHELGHNFGSPHTHNCTWPGGPIDSCYTVEGGSCYSGPAIPIIGTIMSYCHLSAGVSLTKGFGPLPMQLIRSRAEIASCMNQLTGFLVALPNGGEIFRSSQTTPVIWGTSFTGNVNIEYSTNNGTNWTTIQNNVDATLRTADWTMPYAPTVTQGRIRVYESGNTSNGDMSDSSFQIRPNLNVFSVMDPPQLTRMNVYAGDTTKVNFLFTKAGTLPEIKYKWNLSTSNNSLSLSRFSNNNGSDTSLSITKGTLDSIVNAWGAANLGDSLRLRWNVKSYTQLDSLQTNNSFLITFVRSVIGIQTISQVIPNVYSVEQNYPNPFNPVTNIKFGLPKASLVKLTVFDVLGREVSALVNENLVAGEYSADWNAVNFPSGIYFYRIEAGDFVKTAKMILVK